MVGWPQAAGAVVYNAASVLRDGTIEQTYRKRELPNYAVFDERRYFDVDPDRDDCVFEVNGTQVGLVICEDLWFAEPIASTVAKGAQLVLVPNASPFERDKHAQRDNLLAQRVSETGAAIAYLNVVGGQDALVFDGASVVADGDGSVHPAAAAFTDQWLVVEFDPGSRRFTPLQWMAKCPPSRFDRSTVASPARSASAAMPSAVPAVRSRRRCADRAAATKQPSRTNPNRITDQLTPPESMRSSGGRA